jgi:peptide deformylase
MIVTDLKILRKKSTKLTLQQYRALRLFERLEDELEKAGSGVGLAGIQIGQPYRVAIIRLPNLFLNLFNPEVLQLNDKSIFSGEGCLSIPGKVGTTYRYDRIVLKNGDGRIVDVSGVYAAVIQHELDHMDGILFIDRLAKGDNND